LKRLAGLLLFLCLLSLTPLITIKTKEEVQKFDTEHSKIELPLSSMNGDQATLNASVGKELEKADAMLNAVYQNILTKYANDQEFIDKFITAELAWLAYRNAELEAIFPRQDKLTAYGSSYPLSYNLVKAELTWERVGKLNQWLEGLPEGDITAGSRGYKPRL